MGALDERLIPPWENLVLDAAAAVRAHLATVLDAEDAKWVDGCFDAAPFVAAAIDSLRATLGIDREAQQ